MIVAPGVNSAFGARNWSRTTSRSRFSGCARKEQLVASALPTRAGGTHALLYFAKRVGAESATMLQVGTPFDYEKQMRLHVVSKMPDPREAGYVDALEHWIEHFIKQTHG